jgi:pimeloyl-ACP methyl ester carboxylesterase
LNTSPRKSEFVKVNGIRLHYLDWGGAGTALLFLTGMGNSAYIYDEFAPRFVAKFRVIALTRRGHGDSDYPITGYDVNTLTEDVRQLMDSLEIDKAILVGHSMSNVELCHFAALHPERIVKLVFLDAAYNRASSTWKSMSRKNPLRDIQIPSANDDHYSFEDHVAAMKKYYPFWANIWCEAVNEDFLHLVKKDTNGKIIYKMRYTINRALIDTMDRYTPEDSKIQVPVLSIYALKGSDYYVSLDYLTKKQKELVTRYFDRVKPPLQRELIEHFRRNVPHARIVEIPHGHHYCFIKHDELVFDEMRKFLLA